MSVTLRDAEIAPDTVIFAKCMTCRYRGEFAASVTVANVPMCPRCMRPMRVYIATPEPKPNA